MADDYRTTLFCPQLYDITERKRHVVAEILKDHPRAIDMHAYISMTDSSYKELFIEVYYSKCAYCGVSIDIIPKNMFEVDHFIYKSSFPKKSEAGYIQNLILACYTCNHKKSSLPIPERYRSILHPDECKINTLFVRDDLFYIRISDENTNDEVINLFYIQLGLGEEVRRLDYLLMNMIGLQRKSGISADLYQQLGQVIDLLRKKRNMT
ncbi:HNH endonuclease [Brucepastera parasyntrophica]|uniref:HNH endonuclease n=1 Tax=Brucepastera parasyntrophica TaxID=2880008 RepID=UPI00210AC12E|nr:HNH endonuclease [Brucepastera parasyntrophica]ULQ60408.1 HNH endonuclease [Brucepastera parasyntrophica]